MFSIRTHGSSTPYIMPATTFSSLSLESPPLQHSIALQPLSYGFAGVNLQSSGRFGLHPGLRLPFKGS